MEIENFNVEALVFVLQQVQVQVMQVLATFQQYFESENPFKRL
jgi:hypothetical protein